MTGFTDDIDEILEKEQDTRILHKPNLEDYFYEGSRLKINGKLKVIGFENKKELRDFVATSLNLNNLKLTQKTDYQYQINELNLTYITERIK